MAQPSVKVQTIEQYGPYGRQQDHTSFSFIIGKEDKITKVHIESGYIVDSLAFEVVDESGKVKTIWSNGKVTGKEDFKNGKVGAHESHTINLAGEHITQISGFAGDVNKKGRHVVQLFIHTDKVKGGYGPFGTKQECTNITSFKSPDGPSARQVVGFFGTQGELLQSLGISLK